MGEARKRGKFRIIDGGKALRSQPPRLMTHTLLIEEPGHDAIEAMRVKTGMQSAHDFDLFLMGAGMGVIETPHFIVAFNRYVTEIEKMRTGDPSIPQATIQQFSAMIVRIGMGEIIKAAKAAQGTPEAAAPVVTDEAIIVKESVAAHEERGCPIGEPGVEGLPGVLSSPEDVTCHEEEPA